MALPRVHRVCQDQLGNVVPQVQCSVYNEGTGVLATLWQDDAGTIPLTNPMISSTNYGSIDFYVLPGHFDLTFVKSGYTFEPLYDFQVPQDVASYGTMAQQNASAVAITGGTVTGVSATNMTALTTGASGDIASGRNLFASGTSQLAGNVGIGVAPSASLLTLRYATTLGHCLSIQPYASDTAGASALLFTNVAAAIVGSIICNATATAYNTTSDGRLKKDVTPLTGALDVVRRLRPSTGLWRADGSRWHSFLAHEVADVVDGVITGERDAVDDEEQIVPQQIDLSKLVPWLTSACQELAAQVEALQARISGLETQLGV